MKTTATRDSSVLTGRRSDAISAFLKHVAPRLWAGGALIVLVAALGSAGCGSSAQNTTAGPPTKGESRFRTEGTGKNKHEVLVRRRDERIQRQREAAQKGQ